MSGLKKLKDAPRDGTPFLFASGGDVRVLRYLEFVEGYCDVEKCDGAFYEVGDDEDFWLTLEGNEERICLLLTDEQIAAVARAIE